MYRLLEDGEVVKPGDDYYYCEYKKWVLAGAFVIGCRAVKDRPVRRKISDAKEPAQQPNNSDYATALGVKIVVIPGLNGTYLLSDGDLQKLSERLNSALQNFA